MFGVPHNAWDFTTSELWTAAPALTIIAAIAWALPLIAVITPATLSIEISSEPNITLIDSPIRNIDYDQTLGLVNG
ncbi:Ff.00g043220.m01.CDS01 [Fusarium sp. VM40]|nr:Ff.00g043220.m01.CDS01 [Fusarium sp. VM40]